MIAELYHPRRAAIGVMLRHAIPLPDDKEAQAERRIIHRFVLAERVRR